MPGTGVSTPARTRAILGATYRGTSLIRNNPFIGPYSRTVPRTARTPFAGPPARGRLGIYKVGVGCVVWCIYIDAKIAKSRLNSFLRWNEPGLPGVHAFVRTQCVKGICISIEIDVPYDTTQPTIAHLGGEERRGLDLRVCSLGFRVLG